MPSFTTPQRTSDALPATLPRGAAPAVREAATLTLRRLRGWPALSTLTPNQLRAEIEASHREYEETGVGARWRLPKLDGLTRGQLRQIAADLRNAVSAARVGVGAKGTR